MSSVKMITKFGGGDCLRSAAKEVRSQSGPSRSRLNRTIRLTIGFRWLGRTGFSLNNKSALNKEQRPGGSPRRIGEGTR